MTHDILDKKRKFTVAMSVVIGSFVLALTGNLSGGEWVAASGLAVGLFSGFNALVHAKRSEPE